MWAANLSRVLRELLGVSGIGWGGVEARARGSQKPLQSRGVGCWDPELLSAAVDGLGGREERGQVRGVVPEEDGWVTTWLQMFAFQSPRESGLG